MRRSVIAVFSLLVTATMFADDTQRYIVLTDRPVLREANGRARIQDFDNPQVELRNVSAFRNINGFAADLTAEEVRVLRRSRGVREVEEVIERHAFAEVRNPNGQTVPWGIDAVRARDAWVGARGARINVAVLDTGIDYKHPDLAGIYAGGTRTIIGGSDPMDDAGHGTHVAGTIAAADDNAGVVGVAPGVSLWAVKVLNSEGSGNTESITKGIDWVVSKKIEIGGNWVINMSLGSDRATTAERAMVNKALDAGIIIVAASGNDSTSVKISPVSYPAAYPNVITVGAIAESRSIASFSNQGPELDIVAPGVAVLSSVPVNSTRLVSARDGNGAALPTIAVEGSPVGSVNGDYVYCGTGVNPSDFPTSVAGKIALIKRGPSTNTTTATHANKGRNAKQAGAIGVVIFTDEREMTGATLRNTDLGNEWSLTYEFLPTVAIPVNSVGEALAAKGTGRLSFDVKADSFDSYNGTSMATPHVAGAVALMWSLVPNATADEVRKALTAGATDLGAAGPDNVYGYGLLNVFDAAKTLAPYAFGAPVNPANGKPTTGRPIGRRGSR